MIVWFLLILGPAQSQWEEELGKEVEDLDAAEDGEAGEEPHGAADQPKGPNEGHLWLNLLWVICIWISIHGVQFPDRNPVLGRFIT